MFFDIIIHHKKNIWRIKSFWSPDSAGGQFHDIPIFGLWAIIWPVFKIFQKFKKIYPQKHLFISWYSQKSWICRCFKIKHYFSIYSVRIGLKRKANRKCINQFQIQSYCNLFSPLSGQKLLSFPNRSNDVRGHYRLLFL